MSSRLKVIPPIESLNYIKNFISCPEENCECTFKCESNLRLHLIKVHNKQESLQRTPRNADYYCPETSCIYNTEKPFASMKLIKQHYLKVHCKKKFNCTKCKKAFSTEASQKSHEEYCGVSFLCNDCQSSYATYEALQTHARRKKHKIPLKTLFNPNNEDYIVIKTGFGSKKETARKCRLLFPRPTIIFKVQSKKKESSSTKAAPIVKATVSTQTDIEPQNSEDLNKLSVRDIYMGAEKRTLPTFESYPASKTSFGTQTSTFKNLLNKANSDASCQSIACENSLLGEEANNYFSMETQTDVLDYFLPDISADAFTHTQPYDVNLSSEMICNDSHTQTMLSDLLRSVGSQTLKNTSNDDFLLAGREISDIQTQTDVVFQEMFDSCFANN